MNVTSRSAFGGSNSDRKSVKKIPSALVVILLLAFLLRLPSLFEPNWYGDEGIYQVIGKAMAQGRVLYAEIWDNKPPLLYVIYMLGKGEQFWIRFASFLVMFPTIVLFFKLSKRLFTAEYIVYITTFLFGVFFSGPLLEGNIANAENFMYLPILAALYFGFSSNGRNRKFYIFAGLLLGIAFLIKIVAVFDLAALVVFSFIVHSKEDVRKFLTRTIFLVISFAIPVGLTVLYFFLHGALLDFLTATLSQNVSYVGVGNKFFVSQGLLLFKLVLLAIVTFFLFTMRKNFSRAHMFIYVWLAFSLFNAFFGGRPWIHYLLTLLPAFCLFVGMIVTNRNYRIQNMGILLLMLILIYKNFWVYGKTVPYYVNFIELVTGMKNEREYRDFFDWYVNRDYALAAYLKTFSSKDDTIFLWGNNAQVYALADRLPPGRYTVAYHVTFYSNAILETEASIKKHPPAFVVQMQEEIPPVILDDVYTFQTEIEGVRIYARGH